MEAGRKLRRKTLMTQHLPQECAVLANIRYRVNA